MKNIRPFCHDDIPQVVALTQKMFPKSNALPTEDLQANYRDFFLREPWHNPAFPALVYEEGGRIIGFLGVTSRPVLLQGCAITMAVSQHLMVDLERRAPLASLELLRAFLSGPQEISMADAANDISRKLWERLGGTTSTCHSIYWRRLLRPVRAVVEVAATRFPGLKPITWVSWPGAAVADALAARIPHSPLRLRVPNTAPEPLDAATLLRLIEACSRDKTIRPAYHLEDLSWLLHMLKRQTHLGQLHTAVVKNAKGEECGWYVYYFKRRGTCEVIQLGAREDTVGDVCDQLFYAAWKEGATSISGRADVQSMRPLFARACLFIPGRMWTLMHAKHEEVLRILGGNDVFLSRLEGDLAW
jgi:hypothetical protein